MKQEHIEKLEESIERLDKQNFIHVCADVIKILESLLDEVKPKPKWVPLVGDWFLRGDGSAGKGDYPIYAVRGMTFANEEQAEAYAAKQLTPQRIAAFVREEVPDYVADWNNLDEIKYYIRYDHSENKWTISITAGIESLADTPMPCHVAYKLLAMIESGEFEI